MAISYIEYTSEVRIASCAIRAVTFRVTVEVSPCLTLGQILALGNLSEDQYCLIDMCFEAERSEEELDEKLKDSMFILFPSLESFWFSGFIIRLGDL
jgi:hypothetical protein